MPKASIRPEPSNGNRFNPYITKGISKTLLTPCRQVGLSRKRKTPNSNDKISDILNTSTRELAKVGTDTTPLGSKFMESCRSEPKKDVETTSVSKCLIAVEENDHNSLEVAPLLSEQKLDLSSKSPCKNIESENDPFKTETEKTVFNKNKKLSHFDTKLAEKFQDKRKKTEGKLNKKKESKKEKQISLDKTLKGSLNKDKPKEKEITEPTLHTFEEKKSNTFITTEANKVKIISTSEIISEKIPQKDNTLVGENTENKKLMKTDPMLDHDYVRPGKKTKLKRSLSMKKSTEELDAKKSPLLTHSPLKQCCIVLNRIDSKEDDTSENISEEDIKKLQKEVKVKRQLVDDLIQAEIYKKLHNPGKLNELTAAWKTGCISALNDLLPHLQAKGDIDMATLLNNLRVPEKLIKLSDSGELI